jgi:hypothetical protein
MYELTWPQFESDRKILKMVSCPEQPTHHHERTPEGVKLFND